MYIVSALIARFQCSALSGHLQYRASTRRPSSSSSNCVANKLCVSHTKQIFSGPLSDSAPITTPTQAAAANPPFIITVVCCRMCSIFPGRHYFNILFPRVAIKQKFSLKPMADCFKISCDNIDIRLMPASPASDFQQHRSAILLVLVGSLLLLRPPSTRLVCAIIFILRHCCWFSSQSDIMPVSEWSLVYRVGRTAEYNKLPIRSFVQSVASLGRWFPFAAAAALSMGATAAAAAPANTMSLAFLSLRTNQTIQAPTDRPTYLPSTTTPAFPTFTPFISLSC